VAEISVNELRLDANLGQVWTPVDVAVKMVDLISQYCHSETKILDPASGPGTFLNASIRKSLQFKSFDCFEIDARLSDFITTNLSSDNVNIYNGDFFDQVNNNVKYDVAILNPPYIRHENLSLYQKDRLQEALQSGTSKVFSRRMNYFGYFLIKVASQLKQDGLMCAIIYDSLGSTKYGHQIFEYLDNEGEFIERSHVAAPFEGRLIDAEIILWRKKGLLDDRDAREYPVKVSNVRENYRKVSELASVKRGTSFIKRQYFIAETAEERSIYIPLVTKQTISDGLIVKANTNGLLKSNNSEHDNSELLKLKLRFSDPRLNGLKTLPKPVVGQVIFNYYLREHPRHLLNLNGIPASDNFYCLRFSRDRDVLIFWVIANSTQFRKRMFESSRTQGSGLRKLQLFEYLDCEVPDYTRFSEGELQEIEKIGKESVLESWNLDKLCFSSTMFLEKLGFSPNE
jgi:predicted RNA methylase